MEEKTIIIIIILIIPFLPPCCRSCTGTELLILENNNLFKNSTSPCSLVTDEWRF